MYLASFVKLNLFFSFEWVRYAYNGTMLVCVGILSPLHPPKGEHSLTQKVDIYFINYSPYCAELLFC